MRAYTTDSCSIGSALQLPPHSGVGVWLSADLDRARKDPIFGSRGNHPCWRWLHADLREYVDASDFYALTAPRPLVIETGKVDFTFSRFAAPFAADKQILRRARLAYGSEIGNVEHYLHYDQHRYHVGDVNPTHTSETNVCIPEVVEPTAPWSYAWESDNRTFPSRGNLFETVSFFLEF